MKNQFRIWKGTNSLEIFLLEHNPLGMVAGGIIHQRQGQTDISLKYKLTLDNNWNVKSAHIKMLNSPFGSLYLCHSSSGVWMNESGIEVKELRGCTELDISCTPFTNSLPIKKLVRNQSREFSVAIIQVPDLSVNRTQQLYTHQADLCFEYHNLENNFKTNLIVDSFGLISDYSGFYKAVH